MYTETSSSDCPCGPEGDIKGQRQGRFTREVAASAYASHRQGRLYSRKTLALSLAHEGGPLTVMSVAPGWRFSPKPWNQSAPASSQAFPHAWDAVWTPASSKSAGGGGTQGWQAVKEASLLAGSPGIMGTHAHMKLLESLWTIPRSEGNKSRLY